MVLKITRINNLCRQRDAIRVLLEYGYDYLKPVLEEILNELESKGESNEIR